MANHLATRAAWFDNTDLLYTELADLDAKTVDSVSGTGGVYSATGDWAFFGDVGTNFRLYIPTSCISTFDAYEAVTVHQTASFVGAVAFHDDVLIGDSSSDALLILSTTTATAPWAFSSGVTVNGLLDADLATFASSVGFLGDATFGDDCTFNGNNYLVGPTYIGSSGSGHVELNSELNCYAPIKMQAGGYVKEAVFQMTDVDANRGPTTPCSEVFVESGILSANRSFTIVDAGDNAAMSFSISPAETTYHVTVKNPAGVMIGILTNTAGFGAFKWFDARRISGTWTITRSLAP